MGKFNNGIPVEVLPTITAGAYSAGDVIGGLLTFQVGISVLNMVQIRRVWIGDADNEQAPMKLYFFKSAPTAIADNAAFSALTDANMRDLCRMVVPIAATDYHSSGSNAIADVDVNKGVDTTNGAFYVFAVLPNAQTYGAVNDLRLGCEVWPD